MAIACFLQYAAYHVSEQILKGAFARTLPFSDKPLMAK
jgi:hypothetical protein